VGDLIGLSAHLATCSIIIGFGEAVRRAQRRSNDQRELIRVTFASIGDGVITTDRDGRIIYLNTVAESLTGWKLEEASGEPLDAVFRIVSEAKREPVENPARWAVNEGTVVGLANHAILIAKNGAERPIDDSAAPIRMDGDVIGCVLVFRDVTARRRAEEEQRELLSRLDAVITHAPVGIALFDPELRFITLNDRAAEIDGIPKDAHLGKTASELLPELGLKVETLLRQVRDTGEPITRVELTGDTPAAPGDQRHWIASYYPVRNESDKATAIGAVALKITDRKRAEAQLRRSRDELRAKEAELDLVITRTPLLLARSNRDLRYVFVDRAYSTFLHRPPEEIIGQPMIEVIGQAAFDTIKPHMERALSGESVEFESDVCYSGVGRRFMRAMYAPDRNDRGEVIGWVASLIDNTERKQLERERDEREADLAVALNKRTEEARRAEKAEQLLREADRRKDEFLAILAHELRNPLAPIRYALELLRRADDNRTLIEQTQSIIERQVSQMVRLVDDLLDISRITRGKLQVRKEAIVLADVINNAIETARPLFDASGHELTVALPPQALHVMADPTRLAQVFLNLLNNAAKYTEEAGHIWLTVERRGNEAVASVRDTGIGIAAEHLSYIFGMFSQVNSALGRSQGGLGIGLSLIKGLVELHGGTIEARSDGPGKGSEFTVHLPIVDVPVEPSQRPSRGEIRRSGPRRRILVVDDLRDSAESMAMILGKMGHETCTAYDGLDAIQAAAAFQPDVVLLDVGLPKMNGYDVARHIREQPWGGDVGLVALTGWGQEEDKRRSFEAGFDHHLTKPVEAAALEKLLAGLAPVEQE
jgi:PAS domain S-box-containing protein